ncbi:MAG: methyl-accepting chemotaxis protein [Pseudomonadota bacterium]
MRSSIKLRQLLTFGFGAVLCSLLIVAAIGVVSVNLNRDKISEYRDLATSTNLVGRIQANLLMMRVAALRFRQRGAESDVVEFQERAALTQQLVNRGQESLKFSNAPVIIKRIGDNVASYERTFLEARTPSTQRSDRLAGSYQQALVAVQEQLTQSQKSAGQQDDLASTQPLTDLAAGLQSSAVLIERGVAQDDVEQLTAALRQFDEALLPQTARLDSELDSDAETITLGLRALRSEVASLRDETSTINDRFVNGLDRIGPQMAEDIEALKLSIKAEQDRLGPLAEQQSQRSVTVMVGTTLFIAVFGAVFAWFMIRTIMGPIGGEPRQLEAAAHELAQGNLSDAVTLDSAAGGLHGALANVLAQFRTTVGTIIESSQALLGVSQDTASLADENAEIVRKQRSLTDEAYNALTQLADTTQSVAELAERSAAESEIGLEHSRAGRQSVREAVNSIEALSKNIETAVAQLDDVARQASEISKVVDVIQGVSEQTNLLALNAAIEAARAGDNGRGFAVVAEEVRSLAQSAQRSTSEIQDIIRTLQDSSNRVVETMRASNEEVERSVAQSREGDAAFAVISDSIETVSRLNVEVSDAANEQSTAAGSIHNRMDTLRGLLEDVVKSANRLRESGETVRVRVDELEAASSNFRM